MHIPDFRILNVIGDGQGVLFQIAAGGFRKAAILQFLSEFLAQVRHDQFPILQRKGGGFELYKDLHGFVIGGMKGIRYREYTIQLAPGDKIFVYTDGVPEATAASGEMFGTERMVAALNTCANGSPEEILRGMRSSVDAFVGDAEQFDDLTMLCLEYRGPKAR